MKQRNRKLAMLCITAALLTTANATPAVASELEYSQSAEAAEERKETDREAELHGGFASVTAFASETYQKELQMTEEQIAEEEQQEETPELAVAQVENYINVRKAPSLDGELVGKLHNDAVGEIIGEEQGGEWLLIRSGNVEGYIKAEYALRGEEGQEKAEEVGKRYAKVTAVTLRVRQEATTESDTVTLLPLEEVLPVSQEVEGWAKVSTQEGEGYISTEYAEVYTEHKVAESKEEEEERLRREEAQRLAEQEAQRIAASQAANAGRNSNRTSSGNTGSANTGNAGSASANTGNASSGSSNSGGASSQAASQPSHSSSSENTGNSSLGQNIANFALKFVGNPYVYGGTSLTNGADCSGFVQSVFANFGISLPRTSGEQGQCGKNVGGLANARPGDLVSYSGHIGIYIGNGQIVHASSAKTGIKVSNADYRPILSVRRIV